MSAKIGVKRAFLGVIITLFCATVRGFERNLVVESEEDCYAVLVGVDEYEDSDLPTLSYAASTNRPEPEKPELPAKFLSAEGLSFNLIPTGSFMMGNVLTPEEIDKKWPGWECQDAPRHKVTLTQPFYMSRYETTVGQFKKFVDATGYKTTAETEGNALGFDKKNGCWKKSDGLNWKNPGFSQGNDESVICVSWDDAQEYVKWLNQNAKFEPGAGRAHRAARREAAARGRKREIN